MVGKRSVLFLQSVTACRDGFFVVVRIIEAVEHTVDFDFQYEYKL